MNQQHYDSPQNWALLLVYYGYRALLSLLLLLMFVLTANDPLLGQENLALFMGTTVCYALFSIALLGYQLMRSSVAKPAQIFFGIFVDIVALMLITHSSGGVGSGVELLLIVSIAAGNMLLSARLGILLAAVASLGAIGSTAYLVVSEGLPSQQFLPSGLLGMAFFISAIVIQYLTQRIVSAQRLAETRKADVAQLLNINQRIVQKMQTGVVVMNREGVIHLSNAAAGELLGIRHTSPLQQQAPQELIEICRRYEGEPLQFRLRESGPSIQVNLTSLGSDAKDEYLLFLDDMRKLSQQAQQLKLASLGRFTASIAHEIRNPLGAISHAAQLLNESEHLDEGDQRLVDIVCNHADRMNQIIENILQLSRRGKAQAEVFELRGWLNSFIEEYQRDHGGQITLVTENVQDIIQVDPGQLRQVLVNIVSNGLHYSRKHSGEEKVELRLLHSVAADAPILEVIDFGPGVPAEERQQIFEPFFTTRSRGTGLGLYIARELCEANQIYLGYAMTKEGESCFRLQFSHPQRRGMMHFDHEQ